MAPGLSDPANPDENAIGYSLRVRNLDSGRNEEAEQECTMAESEGFEPSVRFNPHNALAGHHLQPLGQLSAEGRIR